MINDHYTPGQSCETSVHAFHDLYSSRVSIEVTSLPVALIVSRSSTGYGSKLNHQGTTGFSDRFHLPGCHLGYLFLTHSQHVPFQDVRVNAPHRPTDPASFSVSKWFSLRSESMSLADMRACSCLRSFWRASQIVAKRP